MIDVKLIKKPKSTGSSTSRASGIVTPGTASGGVADSAKYADHAAVADMATRAQRADSASKADEATHAASAHDVDSDSPLYDRVLRKDQEDTANEPITFKKGLTSSGKSTFEEGLTSWKPAQLEGGAAFGKFVQGFSGAAVDGAGNGEFESLTARSFLKVYELIYNRLNALEGNTSFADVGTIESAAISANGNTVTAVMRRRWEGDFTAFQPGDVVYGYVNELDNEKEKTYYKCWAWVQAVDRKTNTLTLAVYPDAEVPSHYNRPMTAGMIITRWGNNVEATAATAANPEYSSFIVKRGTGYVNLRQRSFYISCDDGNIVELCGVRQPILVAGNYGTVLGRIPEGLLSREIEELVAADQPYLYARGVIVQDLIRINYQGVVQRSANYRGVWNEKTAASDTDYYRQDTASYDTVTWRGDMWQCLSSGAKEEPSENNPAWLRMTGGEEGPHIWEIIPDSPSIVVHWNPFRYTPEILGCSVKLTTFVSEHIYTTAYEMQQAGVRLEFCCDQQWKPYTPGPGGDLELENGKSPIDDEEGNPITLSGPCVDLDKELDMDYGGVDFRLIDIATGEILRTLRVPLVQDGSPGKDGTPGRDGSSGRDGLLVYPAGVYDPTRTYSSEGETCPVVLYNDIYYRLRPGLTWNPGGTALKTNPALDSVNGENSSWVRFDTFDSIFAKVVMAEFGRLGAAVFYGNWMISQQGVLINDDGSVKDSTDGSGLEAFKSGKFLPNIAFDFATGRGRFGGEIQTRFVDITGSLGIGATYVVNDDLKILYHGSSTITVYLPRDAKFIGSKVTICDVHTSLRKEGDLSVTVRAGSPTGNTGSLYGNVGYTVSAKSMSFECGVAEFLAIPAVDEIGRIDPATGNITKLCDWVVLNVAASQSEYH